MTAKSTSQEQAMESPILLDALGLNGKVQLTPAQRQEKVQKDVLNFLEKRRKKHEK